MKFLYSLILVGFASCNYFPCGWDSDLTTVKQTPSTDKLTGAYYPDQITKQIIKGYDHVDSCFIHLDANGTITYRNIPINTFDFEKASENKVYPIDGTGKWKADYKNGTAELNVALVADSSFEGLNTAFRIYEKNGSPVIFIIVSDPDECLVARFVKQ